MAPNNCSTPNLAFWRAFEDKIDKANQKGLYLFLAGLMEPHKHYPTSEEAVRFACWLVARLSGNFVIFSPGFDSPPPNVNVTSLLKAVGSAIKATAPHHLVTNHWSTASDINVTIGQMASLHSESWLDFELYQSGFMDGNEPEIARRARLLAQITAGHTMLPIVNTTTGKFWNPASGTFEMDPTVVAWLRFGGSGSNRASAFQQLSKSVLPMAVSISSRRWLSLAMALPSLLGRGPVGRSMARRSGPVPSPALLWESLSPSARVKARAAPAHGWRPASPVRLLSAGSKAKARSDKSE